MSVLHDVVQADVERLEWDEQVSGRHLRVELAGAVERVLVVADQADRLRGADLGTAQRLDRRLGRRNGLDLDRQADPLREPGEDLAQGRHPQLLPAKWE